MPTDLQLILTLWIGLANLDSYHRILNACVVWMVFLLPAVTTPCNVLTLQTTQQTQVNMAAETLVKSAPLHYTCSEEAFKSVSTAVF